MQFIIYGLSKKRKATDFRCQNEDKLEIIIHELWFDSIMEHKNYNDYNALILNNTTKNIYGYEQKIYTESIAFRVLQKILQ